jgi:uncharacterized protein YjgD (DUF1641 family)
MFDIRQSIYNQHGEIDEKRVEEYVEGIMDEFFASAEAKPVFDQYGNSEWSILMMKFAIEYIGVTPHKMSLAQFNEILFDLFPRKVSTESDSAESIVAELRAFWNFLYRQYGLMNARMIAASLTDTAAKQLERELANPANYGLAKSFFMIGTQSGFDMTTEEGINEFMNAYNSTLAANTSEVEDASLSSRTWEFPSPLSPKQRAERRKKRKTQQQARKRKGK